MCPKHVWGLPPAPAPQGQPESPDERRLQGPAESSLAGTQTDTQGCKALSHNISDTVSLSLNVSAINPVSGNAQTLGFFCRRTVQMGPFHTF